MTHDRARALFEDDMPQLRNTDASRRCARTLKAIARRGGVVTAHDLQRLYGHLEPHQRVVAFVMDTRMPPGTNTLRHTA